MVSITSEAALAKLSFADQQHLAFLKEEAAILVAENIANPLVDTVDCVDKTLDRKVRGQIRFAGGVVYLELTNQLELWVANRENGGGGRLGGHRE